MREPIQWKILQGNSKKDQQFFSVPNSSEICKNDKNFTNDTIITLQKIFVKIANKICTNFDIMHKTKVKRKTGFL